MKPKLQIILALSTCLWLGHIARAYDSLNVRTVKLWPYGVINHLEPYTVRGAAYLAVASGGGIHILGINNPKHITVIGSYPTNSMVRDIKIAGSIAYVANEGEGLLVLDITKPTSPRELGHIRCKDAAYCLTVTGNIVYIADGDSGVSIIDVHDKHNPTMIGWLPSSTPARYLVVRENKLYICSNTTFTYFIVGFPDKTGGISVYDIRDPRNPVFLKNTEAHIADHDVAFYDDDRGIYYHAGLSLYKYNYSTDALVALHPSGYGTDFAFCENILFLSDSTGVLGLDGDIRSVVIRDTTVYSIDSICTNHNYKMTALNGYVYIFGEVCYAYNIAQRSLVEVETMYPTNIQKIAIDENMVYLTTENTLTIVEEDNARSKNICKMPGGFLKSGFYPLSISIFNHRPLISKFDIVSEKNDTKRLIGSRDSKTLVDVHNDEISEVFAVSETIAIACDTGKMMRVCTMGPSGECRLYGAVGKRWGTTYQAMSGKLLYTSSESVDSSGRRGCDSVIVYDISDIARPSRVGSWQKVDTTIVASVVDSSLSSKGFIQRVADTVEAQKIISHAPHGTIKYEESETHVMQLIIHDSLAFVTTRKDWAEYYYGDRLYVLNVKDPMNIGRVSELPLRSGNVTIAVDVKNLYVCDESYGLDIYKLSSLPVFNKVGEYSKTGMSLVGASKDWIWCSLYYGGFQVFKMIKNKD